MKIRLVGEDGEELAVAAASVSNRVEAMAIVLEQLERGAGDLLRYYFGRGVVSWSSTSMASDSRVRCAPAGWSRAGSGPSSWRLPPAPLPKREQRPAGARARASA